MKSLEIDNLRGNVGTLSLINDLTIQIQNRSTPSSSICISNNMIPSDNANRHASSKFQPIRKCVLSLTQSHAMLPEMEASSSPLLLCSSVEATTGSQL